MNDYMAGYAIGLLIGLFVGYVWGFRTATNGISKDIEIMVDL